jgi:hypothetical protein
MTVQADSCLESEQNDTLFISVGGQEGFFGGGSFGPEVQIYIYVSKPLGDLRFAIQKRGINSPFFGGAWLG